LYRAVSFAYPILSAIWVDVYLPFGNELQGQLASHSVDVFAKGFVEIELEIKLKIADGHTGYPRQHIGLCGFIEGVRG
jgi:hypothetical protein